VIEPLCIIPSIFASKNYLLTYCMHETVSVPQEQTACQKAVQEVGGLPGSYVPQCDEDGEYKPVQFHSGTGESWCVTRDGTEIPYTRSPPDEAPPVCEPSTS